MFLINIYVLLYVWMTVGLLYNRQLMQSGIMQELLKDELTFKRVIVFKERPNSNSHKHILTLNQQSITISFNNSISVILPYCDLIGIISEPIGENLYKISINSFPKRARCIGQDRRVIQTTVVWTWMTQAELKKFKTQLLRIITSRSIEDVESLKLLVYLNPNAGSNSQKHFNAMQQYLSFTNFSFDVIRTTHRGHCQQHLATIDINHYQAVIIISGDGLMHQFVNSVVCGKIPVSHVPGGSGNAFAKAQMTLANEECRDQEAMFLVVKGKTKRMNLMKIELQNVADPIYSFLGFEWAFLADIDMNSQFLRCLGGLRFQIYSVYRCLALRRYNGRLTYSLSSAQLPPLDQQITENSFKKVQTQFLNVLFCVIPFISDQYKFAPLLKVEDEAIDMQVVTSQNGRWQLIKYLLSSSSGDHFDKERGEKKQGYDFTYSKIKSFRLQPLGQGEEIGLFGIDGERYDAQPMQASMSDKKVVTFA